MLELNSDFSLYLNRFDSVALKEVCRTMAKVCDVCGKGVRTGMQVSHSHVRTKKKWAPNLQRVKAIIDGTPKRISVCTRCLRSGKVKRAI